MNLIIDIGNNSAKFFLFQGEQIILHTRKENSSFDVIDEWNRLYDIDKVIVSSVITDCESLLDEISKLQCPVIRFDKSTPLPLEVNYRTPDTLGSDRIAAAVGAWGEAPGRNILVIDAGSAITIDFVGKDGAKYDFCVERYLTDPDTDVYKTVGTLVAGDVVDITGFIYWYEGVNTHITGISK